MLLKKKAALLASMLVLNSWAGAVLAEEKSATLNVTAQIAPASCGIAFVGGGDVDFGTIMSTSIKDGVYTFPVQEKTIEISCNNKVKTKLSVVDNKVPSGLIKNDNTFFLVDSAGQHMGEFLLEVPNDKGNIIRSNNGNDWIKASSSFYLHDKNSTGDNKYLSVSNGSINIAPEAVKKTSILLRINAKLNDFDNKFSSENTKVSGNATFAFEYI